MNSKAKVSIIVPVYQVETYLETCVNSLLQQTYGNLEIILVDDGSPDHCGEMCDRFAQQDSRVQVIHKDNGGLSDARNAGLAAAAGDYIVFVDSDDWLALNYVERMIELAIKHGAEIVACQFSYREQETQEQLRSVSTEGKEIILNHEAAIYAWLYKRYYGVSACAKMYAASCMQGISFPKGRVHEDVGTTYKMFLQADKTVYVNEKLYYYRKREESIVNRPFDSRRLDYLRFTREIMELMEKQYPEYQQAAVSRHFQGCIQIGCAMKPVDGALLREIRQYAPKVLIDRNCRITYRMLAASAMLSPSAAIWIARRYI